MKAFRRLNFLFWYFGNPPWDTGISPPELISFLESHPPGRAIDLGCGTGTNVITMAQLGWQVTGVDFAATAVSRARRKIERAGVQAEVYVSDVTTLKGINGPYDFVLDLGCFHGLDPVDKQRYLKRLDQLLLSSGYWMLYGRIRSTPGEGRPGLTLEDMEYIGSHFRLISRQDGFNRNRNQPAVYLLAQKY